MKTLRRGDRGPDVGYLQSRLNARGFTTAVDSDFGPKTDAMVRRFQGSENIVVDGVVGPQTWNLLLSDGKADIPNGLLVAKRQELIAMIPAGAPTHVRKVLTVACSNYGLREIPDGSNSGPEIAHLVTGYDQYWVRLKKGVGGNTLPGLLEKAMKRGYPLPEECRDPDAWCCMAWMNWIRIGLDLPMWKYADSDCLPWKGGMPAPLEGHPCRYFFGNGGQLEEWAEENGIWTPYPGPDVEIPPGAMFTVGPKGTNSDLHTERGKERAAHVGGCLAPIGGGKFVSIEGNVSNMCGSYTRKNVDIRGFADWAKLV